MAVVIALLVGFEDIFVESVVASSLEPDVDAEGNEEDDGGGAGDAEGFGFQLVGAKAAGEGVVEDRWDDEAD